MTRPLPVTVDVGPAVHQRAGLSRYTTQLVTALHASCSGDVSLRLVYNRHSDHTLPPPLAALPVTTLPLNQLGWRLSVLASQVTRLQYAPLRRGLAGCSVYHATEHLLPRLACPTVLTIHDLIFEHYPQHHTWRNRLFLRAAMPLFVAAADRIVAVSRHTAQDLTAIYGVSPAKLHVVYEGVDPQFRPQPREVIQAVRDRYSPDRPYLLMLGTLEPRKNHTLALELLAHLKAQGYPHRLLVGGGAGWLFEPVRRRVDELDLTGDVTFTGYVPPADLPGLYAAAACFLMPSLYEGFGLPVLEAMACGTPVVASHASSLPEVVGDVAPLLPPHDVEAWVAAVKPILDDPAAIARLRERGVAHAARFTWTAAAQATVQVYRAAAGH
jgi:glycosyltransferase involved in cell wall biosynthesis